jgi:deazaflavin-dependent oxidoreductase (nitroreductase family)
VSAVDTRAIRTSAAEHVARYLATDGADGYLVDQWPTLLITTTGRSSGEPRIAPLIFGRDGRNFIVVASFGGSDSHPAWYLNLDADPRVFIQVKAHRFAAVCRLSRGAERERLWESMVELFPYYAGYAEKASREIPVVVIEPASGVELPER